LENTGFEKIIIWNRDLLFVFFKICRTAISIGFNKLYNTVNGVKTIADTLQDKTDNLSRTIYFHISVYVEQLRQCSADVVPKFYIDSNMDNF